MSTPYQPAPMGQPAPEPPPSNLVWGILCLVLCGGGLVGLVAGIVSIVNATQVSTKWSAGDFAGAQESSRKAKSWAIWGAVISLVLGVIILIGLFALGGLASMSEA
jgi:hypothetical protein